MRRLFFILMILIPLVCWGDPWDSGVMDAQLDVSNSWTAGQHFPWTSADSAYFAALYADTLTADSADVNDLTADTLTVLGYATIDSLDAEEITADTLTADSADVNDLTADTLTVLGFATIDSLDAEEITADTLTADSADVNDLTADTLTVLGFATIDSLDAAEITAATLTADSADVNDLTVDTLTVAEFATIDSLDAAEITADTVRIAANGEIMFGDGDTGITEEGDDIIHLWADGLRGGWTNLYFYSLTNDGFRMRWAAGTSTSPVYTFRGNTDIGMTAITDSLYLISGGVTGMTIAEGAGNNSILVTVNGDFAIGSSGSFTGNSNIRGSDSFDGTCETDTIFNDNFDITDVFNLQLTGMPGDSIKVLFADATEDTLIVRRCAGGDAGQTYSWRMMK